MFVLLLIFFAVYFMLPFAASGLYVERPLKNADAIFVLGGSAAYLERTRKAAELYKSGVSQKIFLTNDGAEGGWDQNKQRNPFFVERAQKELSAQGVPSDAVEVLPGIVQSTRDEAELAAKVIREKNLKSLLPVTSAYHTRRTFQIFEQTIRREGLTAEIGIEPAEDETARSPEKFTIVSEYVKLFYYQMFY